MVRPILALLTAALLWSTSFPLIKWGLASVPPFTFAFWRFVLASLFFLGVLGHRWREAFQALRHHRALWGLAALNALGYVFQFTGQQFTNASRAALWINMYVLWVPLLAWVVHGRRPGRQLWLALALAWMGLVLVTTGAEGWRVLFQIRWKGDLLTLLASISWAVYILLAKETLDTIRPVLLSFAVIAGSVPFLLPFYLTEGGLPTDGLSWAMIGYLALFCTVLPYVLYAWGLERTTPTFSSLVLLFEVLMAAVFSWIALGERFTFLEGVGGLLILAGIGLGSLAEASGTG